VIININNKTKNGTYPFLKAVDSQNIEIVNFLMNYVIKKIKNGNYPLLNIVVISRYNNKKYLNCYWNMQIKMVQF